MSSKSSRVSPTSRLPIVSAVRRRVSSRHPLGAGRLQGQRVLRERLRQGRRFAKGRSKPESDESSDSDSKSDSKSKDSKKSESAKDKEPASTT